MTTFIRVLDETDYVQLINVSQIKKVKVRTTFANQHSVWYVVIWIAGEEDFTCKLAYKDKETALWTANHILKDAHIMDIMQDDNS